MQPRRATIPPSSPESGGADGTGNRKAPGLEESRVVALYRRKGGTESRMREPERADTRDENLRRFDAFIDGLCDAFARGGIAEVRKLARAAAIPPHATAASYTPAPGARTARPALACSRRRSEVDMFLTILSALDRAQRRGGLEETLAEFSRIGRRVGPLVSPGAPRQR